MEQSSNAQRGIRIQPPLVSLLDHYPLYSFYLHQFSTNSSTFKDTHMELLLHLWMYSRNCFKILILGAYAFQGLLFWPLAFPTLGVSFYGVLEISTWRFLVCSAACPGNLWNLLAEVSENCLPFEFYIAFASDFSMSFYVVTPAFVCAAIQA